MIQNRINYLLETLDLSEDEIKEKVKTRRSLRGKIQDLKMFFEVIKTSLLTERGRHKPIVKFIESVAGGDMRRALELFNLFLVSGNTKANEILSIYRGTGQYQIAYHQLIKSIILGESRYYSSIRSYIMNVFDVNTDYTNSHFLHLKILQYANDRIHNETRVGRGYLSINKLKHEAEKIFISREAIDDSLSRLARFKLIVFDNQDPEGLEEASYYKITPTGIYYLEALSRRFVYLDLVWMDTPIADAHVETELRHVIDETNISVRFERTSKFLNYLKEMERIDFETNPSYHLSELGKYFFMKRIISSFKYERNYIRQRLMQKWGTI